MRLLLDTHVVLWWLDNPALLSTAAQAAIKDQTNTIFVSAAVAWEIGIKQALGKLSAPPDFETAIQISGFRNLPITVADALEAGRLPVHHRDPFDRNAGCADTATTRHIGHSRSPSGSVRDSDHRGMTTTSNCRTGTALRATQGSRGGAALITNTTEYDKAQDELEHLEEWLKRVEREHPLPDLGLSKAGIRKMIARRHEDLGAYEGTLEVEAARV